MTIDLCSPYRLHRLIAGVLCLAGLWACGRSGPRPITESRTIEAEPGSIRWNAPDEERFGMETAPQPAPFAWTLPAGWTELPTTEFRQANFKIAARPEVECYMSMVGGGAQANVNRWRAQMGQPALSPQEVQELPRKAFLGTQALYVEMDGTFSGMGGTPRPDYALAGLILETPQAGTVTFKIVGPGADLRAELEHFLAVAESFRIGGGARDPHGGMPPPDTAQPPAMPGSGSGLQWDVPEGWSVAAARMMRDVTFEVGQGTECWVSTLGGDGGGEAANLQRWRNEMGGVPLASQEPIDMLGGRGTFVEIRGSYGGGRSGQPVQDAVMLAAMRSLGDRTIFVKMIGPRAEVEAAREAFLRFCSSLRL